ISEGVKQNPLSGKQRVLEKEIAMKLTITSLISTDIIAHGFLLDIPERWILVGLVLVVIRVTRR
ncbi:hypothetical protein HMPREF3036_02183, partial [Sutterella sp. KLE1602]|uniref:hypothetical protein n=1 Tax=Sutterella sp. KLE1602 TaxID=1574262 RepID=UPI000792247E